MSIVLNRICFIIRILFVDISFPFPNDEADSRHLFRHSVSAHNHSYLMMSF